MGDAGNKPLIGYVYSPSRSGERPVKVLGDTVGCSSPPSSPATTRSRCPAVASARAASLTCAASSSDARSTSPQAQTAMDFIVEVYKVERAALDDDLLGADAHPACASRSPIVDSGAAERCPGPDPFGFASRQPQPVLLDARTALVVRSDFHSSRGLLIRSGKSHYKLTPT